MSAFLIHIFIIGKQGFLKRFIIYVRSVIYCERLEVKRFCYFSLKAASFKCSFKSIIVEPIESKDKCKFVATTSSEHKEAVVENLNNIKFTPKEVGVTYVFYITYLRKLAAIIYLTIVMDIFDQKIIRWTISYDMSTEESVIPALRMAVKNRKPKNSVIFYSTIGAKYVCKKARNLLLSYEFIQSMSRKRNCCENAIAENFFKTLKCEWIFGYKPKTKK
ncbi:MAG: transposase [Bacteroidales bacterium]